MIADPPLTNVSAAEIRRLVARASHSETFRRSPQLIRFLEYICDQALEGETATLSEQQIGERVFKRSPNYNTGDDSIVRAHARLLRKKLDLYFSEEGKGEPILISVPRGSYVPQFFPKDSNSSLEIGASPVEDFISTKEETPQISFPPALAPEPNPIQKARLPLQAKIGGLAVFATIVVLAILRPYPSQPNILWRTIFTKDHPAIFIPGDSGLILYQNLTGRNVGISEYSNGSYLGEVASSLKVPPDLVQNIASRRYTSIPDLRMGLFLQKMADATHRQLVMRYARDLRMDDLKSATLIINGDPRANPWVSMFDPALNFTMEYDQTSGVYTIHNKHPHAGEQSSYQYSPNDPSHKAYVLVSMVSGLNGSGDVLLVESTTMAGTDAAVDFLSNQSALKDFLRRVQAREDKPLRFEALLRTENIGLTASHFNIEAYLTNDELSK